MNFHQLLHQRDALLRQARLANMAYACRRLGEFAGRITRARLHGAVRLEELEDRFLSSLRRELALAGINPGPAGSPPEDSNHRCG